MNPPPLLLLLILNLLSSLTDCTTINSDNKIELPSVLISCKLNDIIIISAPEVGEKARYYLNKPNGDVIKLPNLQPKYKTGTNYKVNETIINTKYRVFNVNNSKYNNTNDIFNDNLKKMGVMDFMMGPLGEDDHGNWVLSMITDSIDDAIEFFQVISIEIIEKIPVEPSFPKLIEGSNFTLKFAYTIKHLESCELRGSMGDRYFSGTGDKNSCEFVVPNITKEDQGWWDVVGVGKIVYQGRVYLKVINKKT